MINRKGSGGARRLRFPSLYCYCSDSEVEAETRRIIDEDQYDFISTYGMDYNEV